ncbi:MAG TPA: lyase family protein [Jatrophihabitans sp.]|nr:lyase family protein [Jatrophihabitans sp.]
MFDPVFGWSAAAELAGDRAWLAALCRVEAALATACATAGLIPSAEAERIRLACDPAGISLPAQQIEAGGNPVIPLASALRQRAGTDAVHLGATSQDVLDTAAMLISREVLALIRAELAGCEAACAALAERHAGTPMIGRTLLQQAEPTTFGVLAAGWGTGLRRALRKLSEAELSGLLAVQLGGAAGTLAGWHPHGAAVRAALAAELGLADPGTTWHTERGRIAELAGLLGLAATAIGKPATDVVLLAQSELAEVAEANPGGSSAMAHKRNPIAAVTARAAAAQAPGLVATLLAAGAPELQRGAGPWHAEWPALRRLLLAVAGGAARLRVSLGGLRVDEDALRAHLPTGPVDVGHAADLVAEYLEGRTR